MSDDIRREDVLEVLSHQRAGYHDESLPGAIVNLIESRIRALPPSPRAAAAQRLAEIELARLDAIEGVNDGSFLPMTEDGFEAWMEWFDMLDAAKTEALAAWREGENQKGASDGR